MDPFHSASVKWYTALINFQHQKPDSEVLMSWKSKKVTQTETIINEENPDLILVACRHGAALIGGTQGATGQLARPLSITLIRMV